MTHPLTPQPHFKRQKYLHYPYKIDNCLMMNDGNASVLYRDDATGAGSRQFTFSCWLKYGDLPNYQVIFSSSLDGGNFAGILRQATNGQIVLYEYQSSVLKISLTTTEYLRDLHNWYHVVVVLDTLQPVAANRAKIWVNNHQCTLTGTFPVQNAYYLLPDAYNRGIGRWRHAASNYYDGLMTELVMLSDQTLTPSSFGTEINGVWVPTAPQVDFSNPTDIYLRFDDVSNLPTSLGVDKSGNDNTFIPYQFSTWDSGRVSHMTDSPTNNHCNMDIIKNSLVTHAWCGLWTQTSTASAHTGFGTFGVNSGKWYFEYQQTGGSSATILMGGICGERNGFYNNYGWQVADGYMYYAGNGKIYNNNDGGSVYGNTYTTGDIIGVAFDADEGTLEFFKNDVSQGVYDITAKGAGLDGRFYFPAVSDGSGSYYSQVAWNFGQMHGGFWGTKPAGFKALCAKNLPEPVIRKPEKAMDVLLWTGDGNATKQLTGLEFEPNIVWIKGRSGAYSHMVSDSINGPGHAWWPDASAQGDLASSLLYGSINSFNPDGITVNKGNQTSSTTNTSGQTYVAWCLKALPQYGIDIVAYTGNGTSQAIPHKLGAKPHMILVKNFSATANNPVYNWQLLSYLDPWTDVHYLDLSNAGADVSTAWNDTAPTETHFTVGSQTGTNGNGHSMIAYLFTSIPGFSRVFRWYGNGSANGPTVRFGFKPRFIIWKNANSANSWWMYDSERDPLNPAQHRLHPDLSAAENVDGYYMDFLSNGVKIRSTIGGMNTASNWFWGIAFAERPFKYSNAAI